MTLALGIVNESAVYLVADSAVSSRARAFPQLGESLFGEQTLVRADGTIVEEAVLKIWPVGRAIMTAAGDLGTIEDMIRAMRMREAEDLEARARSLAISFSPSTKADPPSAIIGGLNDRAEPVLLTVDTRNGTLRRREWAVRGSLSLNFRQQLKIRVQELIRAGARGDDLLAEVVVLLQATGCNAYLPEEGVGGAFCGAFIDREGVHWLRDLQYVIHNGYRFSRRSSVAALKGELGARVVRSVVGNDSVCVVDVIERRAKILVDPTCDVAAREAILKFWEQSRALDRVPAYVAFVPAAHGTATMMPHSTFEREATTRNEKDGSVLVELPSPFLAQLSDLRRPQDDDPIPELHTIDLPGGHGLAHNQVAVERLAADELRLIFGNEDHELARLELTAAEYLVFVLEFAKQWRVFLSKHANEKHPVQGLVVKIGTGRGETFEEAQWDDLLQKSPQAPANIEVDTRGLTITVRDTLRRVPQKVGFSAFEAMLALTALLTHWPAFAREGLPPDHPARDWSYQIELTRPEGDTTVFSSPQFST